MTGTAPKKDKPDDPPYGGGEDEQPKGNDPQESGADVKEPSPPLTKAFAKAFA